MTHVYILINWFYIRKQQDNFDKIDLKIVIELILYRAMISKKGIIIHNNDCSKYLQLNTACYVFMNKTFDIQISTNLFKIIIIILTHHFAA